MIISVLNNRLIIKDLNGGEVVEKFYGPLGLEGYVSKYIDKNGCTLEEACNELEVNVEDIFNK